MAAKENAGFEADTGASGFFSGAMLFYCQQQALWNNTLRIITHLVLPSSAFVDVPGFFEADFRLEKNPEGFAATLMTFVFATVASTGDGLVASFGSPELLVALATDPPFAPLLASLDDFLESICRSFFGPMPFEVLAASDADFFAVPLTEMAELDLSPAALALSRIL